jgi:uncharacterized protein YecE (DUF72 family)
VTGTILLGTQGWSSPDWVGPFYPHSSRPSEFLGIYARAFPTVEVDSTFYTIPAEPIVAGWREHTPPGFIFSLKVPQDITHEKRLVEVGPRLTRFLSRISALGDRLGPLLIQLSPDFRATDASRETVREFLRSLSRDFRWAIEFRQPQWLSAAMMDDLRELNVALALADGRWIKRGVVLDLAIEPTADFGYLRWSGPIRKGPDQARQPVDRTREIVVWADAIRKIADRVKTVFGYFSNRFQGHAPASARQLQQQLGMPPVEPTSLREQAELF